MDKIIKTISESGAFRAYVLDSTETVRTAQEKHHTQASSTVALGDQKAGGANPSRRTKSPRNRLISRTFAFRKLLFSGVAFS